MPPSGIPTYFTAPFLDRYLVYAPLQRFSAILTDDSLKQLESALLTGNNNFDLVISEIVQRLDSIPIASQSMGGKIRTPLFLGLITTRGCNMACRYCDFNVSANSQSVMTLGLARAGIDAYLNLLAENGIVEGEIQFFGGEPFFQNIVPEFALSYAHTRASQMGIAVRCSVTTNGLMTEKRAAWVADHFDVVVLSFDGAAFQGHQRPLKIGRSSYPVVHRTAEILSDGNTNLTIRACITRANVAYMPELASEFASNYILSALCFEPLTESRLSKQNGLFPPDPAQFARQYCLADDLLTAHGIQSMSSGTDIDSLQTSFCPVGRDALLVSPSGNISACYLVESDWKRAGLDLTFGIVAQDSPRFLLDLKKLETIHELVHHPAPLCETCLCYYHCAGGCYVNHHSIQRTNQYDAVCIRTRLITIGKLLKRMGDLDLYHRWLDSI
jgi:uncharacterized protein